MMGTWGVMMRNLKLKRASGAIQLQKVETTKDYGWLHPAYTYKGPSRRL